MLIESILYRPGGSFVTIADVTHHFTSPTGEAPHVAYVDNPAHAAILLAIAEGFRPALEPPPPTPPAPKTFLDIDGNRSGTVSKAEAQAAFRAHFGTDPSPQLTPRQLVAAIYADRLGEVPADEMTIKQMVVALTDIPG